jgi:NAD(P)H-nitrite reductase large subunit
MGHVVNEVIRKRFRRNDSGFFKHHIQDSEFLALFVFVRNADHGAVADPGITIHKGIVIQESLQTSVPDVYAAGDVVEYRDLVSNSYSVSGSWANAEEMGTLPSFSKA